jgi:hypothetical protein
MDVVQALEEAQEAAQVLRVHGDEEERVRGGEMAHQPRAHDMVAKAEMMVEEDGGAAAARRGPEVRRVVWRRGAGTTAQRQFELVVVLEVRLGFSRCEEKDIEEALSDFNQARRALVWLKLPRRPNLPRESYTQSVL